LKIDYPCLPSYVRPDILLLPGMLKGRIKDRHQHLPTATVTLLDSDSLLVKGVVTDITGQL